MSQLPEGTLGDAVGVLIYTFICMFCDILLIWLYWTTREGLSYVALIAYFALLCTISSIIQQIYNYTFWNDIMWAQLHYIQANFENADVAFNNGNFGFMRALANIRLFCYIMEASYFLSYSIHVTASVFGYWLMRRRAERIFSLASKTVPLLLAGITIALLHTKLVQSSFLTYMIVANVQSVVSCAISIALILVILWKYIEMKRSFRRVDTTQRLKNWRFPFASKDNLRADANTASIGRDNRVLPAVFDNNWLVIRLSIAIVLISGFVLASVITHLPQRENVAKDAQAEAPDLSVERARSNIVGYTFGVTPGLAIWIVFGLTKAYRQIMYEKLLPRKWLGRASRRPSLPKSAYNSTSETPNTSKTSRPNADRFETDVGLQLDDFGQGLQASRSNLTAMPLLVYSSGAKSTGTERPIGTVGQPFYPHDSPA
ncbi:hypothetical protein GGS23DRAFT_593288 [Durotheca rogersii]|uniref:uncharacterized protein n=1 Tax=Durotheca rogersii TaxID=419775 RepID=UPI00221FDE13|nr:uncharacterized protein GGS23DRAFT_593288 [Durotheca rogersii]KAI5866542.1 hypothetical protein GGS23DRAFT_593288 [Durotheca rogersii]